MTEKEQKRTQSKKTEKLSDEIAEAIKPQSEEDSAIWWGGSLPLIDFKENPSLEITMHFEKNNWIPKYDSLRLFITNQVPVRGSIGKEADQQPKIPYQAIQEIDVTDALDYYWEEDENRLVVGVASSGFLEQFLNRKGTNSLNWRVKCLAKELINMK